MPDWNFRKGVVRLNWVAKWAAALKRLKTTGLEVCVLLSAGVANQSDSKSHISYCVTAKSHIVHMGTHEHNAISSSLTHILLVS